MQFHTFKCLINMCVIRWIACRIRVSNFDVKHHGRRSIKASWAPELRSSTLAPTVCRVTSSTATHHPNPWQLRYAGSALPRVFRSGHFQLGIVIPDRPSVTAHSTSHRGAGGCSNGSNFPITGWRYALNRGPNSFLV